MRILFVLACVFAAVAARAADAATVRIRGLKVLVPIYRGADGAPNRLDDAAVEGTRRGIEYGRLFYFRNTRGQLNLEITYRVFDATMPNNTGPTYDAIEADLRARGVKDNEWDGIYATGVGASGNWGGFRILGKTGAAFGLTARGVDLGQVPARDTDTWYNTAWTFVHEFQHALEIVITRLSGRMDMLSAHPYSDSGETGFSWGRRGAEHWDWIAHTLRTFPDYLDVTAANDAVLTATDTDADGLPDDDPRLPMDERRFGSDPQNKDTDGDGLDDLAEFSADIYRGADPRRADTDGDGRPDGTDRHPTVAIADTLSYAAVAPEVDGRMDDSYRPLTTNTYFGNTPVLATAKTFAAWNEDGLSLFVQAPAPLTLDMKIDTSAANGFWEGGDTYGIRAAPDGTVTFTLGPSGPAPGARAAWGADGLEVFIPAIIGQGLSNEVNWGAKRRAADVTDGLVLEAGREVGFNLSVSNKTSRTLITPQWTMFEVTPEKPAGAPPRPSLRFSPRVSRAANPAVLVSGVGPADRVAVVRDGRVVGERLGNGPVVLTGSLRTGPDPARAVNALRAVAGGRISEPITLIVDTGANAPALSRATDGRSLAVRGEPNATVDVFVGLGVSPVWGVGSVTLDARGQGTLALPDSGRGFVGAYGRAQNWDAPAFWRIDPAIRFDYQANAADPRLDNDNFHVRWTGTLDVPADGDYTFHLSTDDGSRLYVDGAVVIDHWGHHAVAEKSATVRLTRGEHPLRLDYYEEDGWAAAHLEWSGPGIARTYALPVRPLPAAAGAPAYFARQTDAAGNVSAFARALKRRDMGWHRPSGGC